VEELTMNAKRIVLMLGLLAAFPALALAEDGRPSQATLTAMGLSGLQVMSDDEAMAVRGKFAVAGGISIAYIPDGGILPPAGSVNFHLAAGKHYAAGANNSYADRLKVNGHVVVAPVLGISGDASIRYKRYSAGGSSWAASL
jgi:hypothetical protein